MSVRKNSVKLGLATTAIAGLAFAALAPANADAGPSTSPKLGTDIIGVGSDTTQWVMDQLTTDYNKAHTTGAQLINYDACLGNTTAGAPGLGDNPDGSGFPCGADSSGTKAGVKRDEGVVDPAAAGGSLPSGSGDGRTLLRTPTDKLFSDVAFGRSSGPINTADLAAGEKALPFAVDKIVVATNPNGPAPASLSGQQLLKIFNGTYTNWNQVGGKDGVIHAYLPKSGSSTLNAFEAFLAQLDGVTEAPGTDNDPASHSAAKQTWQGPSNPITDANWNTGTTNVEEHDPSAIIADKNAIEPFSYGRAQLANKKATSVRIEGGWSADRELYNVVRGQAISGGTSNFIYGSDSNVLEGIFSNTGWICTDPTAQADITNAGFWPLSASTCGVANGNTLDTINAYASNGVGEGAATSTTAQYRSGSVFVTVEAATGSAVPTGKVQVVVAPPTTPGQPAAKAAFTTTVALASDGTAQVKLPASVKGRQVVDVSYLPTGFGSLASAGGHSMMGSSYAELTANVAGTVVTKAATTTKAKAQPAVLATAKKASKVTVTVTSKSGKPAGSVKLTEGKKVVATGKLKAGKVVLTVKGSKLKKGKNKLTAAYAPTGNFKPSKGAVTITRKK